MDSASLRDSLRTLAQNHHWTWSMVARQILDAVPGADASRHPVQLVDGLTEDESGTLLGDQALMDQLTAHVSVVADMNATSLRSPDIAYFSPEFGISDLVPQYSGGLGILAGDHLKAASDLGIALCGVGLFYAEGFFRQTLQNGKQAARYESYDADQLGCVDTGLTVSIPFPGRNVSARVWRLAVGRISLLLLDTNVEDNSPDDRSITDRLYSGDRRHRLEQELVLGVGGARALAELGWDVPVHHLNEGHAGFLILELLDRHIEAGQTVDQAIEAVGPGLVFTTHTPVPAGIDRFDLPLATEYLSVWAQRWHVPTKRVLALGSDPTDTPASFNMAALCLKIAGRANGVSKLHGRVSRELFAKVPGGRAISSVTNGVHARTWVMPRLQEVFDKHLGRGWADGDPAAWTGVEDIDDKTIRTIRRKGADDLHQLVSERSEAVIEPDALIVGFARRFATYKRATLLLQRPDELLGLLGNDHQPVQFVFAGKAHPADSDGQALLADIVAFGASPAAQGRFIFVPDYDIAVARAMYAGCDVWLNNPVRPHEASGTSGEKSALNGGLNCSISDGWWDEMADGRNGWTIPASTATDPTERDLDEATSALALLGGIIIPEFYASGTGWSRQWLARMRHNWRTLGPQVTAARMVADYQTQLYQPALADAASP